MLRCSLKLMKRRSSTSRSLRMTSRTRLAILDLPSGKERTFKVAESTPLQCKRRIKEHLTRRRQELGET